MFVAANVPLGRCMRPPDRERAREGGSGSGYRSVVAHRSSPEGSRRTIAIVASRDGSPQEKDVQGAARQASRDAQARGPETERVPGLSPPEAAAPDVPDVQDVSRARSRAAAHPGSVESPRSQSTVHYPQAR